MTTVTEAEFRENVVYMFKALDMDRNDFLDWKECKDVVAQVMKADGGYNADSFKAKYESMDKNKDGCISKTELIEAVIELGRERKLFVPELNGPGARKGAPMTKQHPNIGGRAIVQHAVLEEPDVAPVDPQIFKDGLSCLGKTFNNARHAYLKLNINKRELSTLKGVERYKYLQYLDVSENKLTTLNQLSTIKHLIKLNASNNLIKKMFDFAPMANLEVVDYSHNDIEVIENVGFNPYLKHLCLDDNKIKVIKDLSSNKSLTSLSLRQNQIPKIENLDHLFLEELNLSQNEITKISGLSQLPCLKQLDLSKNHIQHLVGLQRIDSLRFLNLSLNNIVKVLQLQFIERLSLLTEIDFSFNPIQNKKHYRS